MATTRENLMSGAYDAALNKLYTTKTIDESRSRCLSLLDDFTALYGEQSNVRFFSAPGRTEVGGNHTDHNHGKVLAASINLDALAAVSQTDNGVIRVKSRGYEKTDVVDLSTLTPIAEEKDHSASLIRGVAARLVQLGYRVGGFDAATTSDVLSGSGLSSSAAFEVLIGTILNYFLSYFFTTLIVPLKIKLVPKQWIIYQKYDIIQSENR